MQNVKDSVEFAKQCWSEQSEGILPSNLHYFSPQVSHETLVKLREVADSIGGRDIDE